MFEFKGYISIEHTMWCGGCSVWVQEAVPTKRMMGKVMRARGWILTRKAGWLCPKCQKAAPV